MVLYYLYRIGRRLALMFPVCLSYRLAVFFGRIKFAFAEREREYIRKNLAVIKGRPYAQINRDAKTLYENFGRYLIDFFRAEKIGAGFIKKYLTIEGVENMDEALRRGRGAVGCTAHIGNWELCARVLAVLGYKVNAVALTHKNRRINDFFLRQRQVGGLSVVPVGISVRRCFSALKRNEIVGILADKDFSGTNGIRVGFLGKQMLAPRGPAVLSLKTGAPVVPVFIIRDKDRPRHYRYCFTPPIYPEKTGGEEEDIRRLTEKIMRVIERYVRAYPQQWFMFREFWKAEKVEVL